MQFCLQISKLSGHQLLESLERPIIGDKDSRAALALSYETTSIECVSVLYLYCVYPTAQHFLISCNIQEGFLFFSDTFLGFQREGMSIPRSLLSQSTARTRM